MTKSYNLRDQGLKLTGPRLKILHLFEHSSQRHLSADDVYKNLIEAQEEIGIATVYRVLTQFEQAGILIRHHFEGDRAFYELNQGEHHDHMFCTQCGTVSEFLDHDLENIQEAIAQKYQFKLQDHVLYLYGICSVCQSLSPSLTP
jgi:Fur family ferric uptake transcriptional regulator